MNANPPVARIAHAYGNRRQTLAQALAADIDIIEADIWYGGGRIEVRHERRLGWLPLLVDKRSRGIRQIGPWALPLPRRYYARLDVSPLLLTEVLETTAGTRRLMLDVKAPDPRTAEAFAAELAREIKAADATGWVSVCGQFWPVLACLQEAAPELELRYSIERPAQWEAYVDRLALGEVPPRVCIQHRFLDAEKAEVLESKGVEAYCWTVDDAAEARSLVARGVDGITSNDLGLLAGLHSPLPHPVEG